MIEELKQIIDLYNYTQGIIACLIIIAICSGLTMVFTFARFYHDYFIEDNDKG